MSRTVTPGPRRSVARLIAETKVRKGARASAIGASATMTATIVVAAFGFALEVFVAGCASIGPPTVPRDRVNYITAVAKSWKEQTLLNVVRMRYGDAPSFLDVSSVISAYAFQGQLSSGAAISSNLTNTIPSNLVTLGGNASYLDRPTITYTPLAGDKFAKSLLRQFLQRDSRADSGRLPCGRGPSDLTPLRSTVSITVQAWPRAHARRTLSSIRSSMHCGACNFLGPSVCVWKSTALTRRGS